MGDYSPEKAGVGGSTPSLATMFSITCRLIRNAPCLQLTAIITEPSLNRVDESPSSGNLL